MRHDHKLIAAGLLMTAMALSPFLVPTQFRAFLEWCPGPFSGIGSLLLFLIGWKVVAAQRSKGIAIFLFSLAFLNILYFLRWGNIPFTQHPVTILGIAAFAVMLGGGISLLSPRLRARLFYRTAFGFRKLHHSLIGV